MALTVSLWASSPGGIEWFLEKRDSWKFCPDLDISEAFVLVLKSRFQVIVHLEGSNFKSQSWILKSGSHKVSNLPFYPSCPVAPRGTGQGWWREEGKEHQSVLGRSCLRSTDIKRGRLCKSSSFTALPSPLPQHLSLSGRLAEARCWDISSWPKSRPPILNIAEDIQILKVKYPHSHWA